MEKRPLVKCPECGRSQTVTAIFLNLTHKEEREFFRSKKVVLLLNAMVIGAVCVLFALLFWFIFFR